MSSLKVSIVGAGNVGKTLGKAIAKQIPISFGVRNPAKYADLQGPNMSVLSVAEAVKASDVVLLAVPGAHDDEGIRAIAQSLGPEISGKVLIDVTNPLSEYPGLEVRWTAGTSGGEVLAAALPDTTVYKAFNTIGENLMSHGDGSTLSLGQPLTMLFAGGPERREQVEAVISAVGFAPMYVGPIRYARNLEALAELWIHLSVPGVGTADKWGYNFTFQAHRG